MRTSPEIARGKILIVEDTPANVKFAVSVLEHCGYEVLQAKDALAGMDGVEATRQFKANPATRHIAIHALTAFAMKGDGRFRDAGCDGYLSKPVGYKDLQTTAASVMATVRAATTPPQDV